MARAATRRELVVLVAAALVVLVATSAFQWSRADDASSWDVPLYESFGERISEGEFPYRDLRIEYPPGSLPAFVLPALIANKLGPGGASVYEPELNDPARSFALSFAALMIVLLGVTIVATAISLGALAASVSTAALALGVTATMPVLLGELSFTRFDALPAALTAVAMAAVFRGHTNLAGGVLGLAIATKLYPGLVLPLVVLYVLRTHGRRAAIAATGWAVGTAAAVLVPFLVVAPSEAWFSVRAQLTRGLQVESLPGSAVLALDRLLEGVGAGGIASVDEGGTGAVRSADIVGSVGSVVGAVFALLAIGVVLWAWRVAARRAFSATALVSACAVVLAAQLAFGRVLSPQFVLWLLPFVPLVARNGGRVALALFTAVLLATHVWFPGLYRDYVNVQAPFETAFLVARNILLVALLVVLVRRYRDALRSPSTAPAASSRNAGASGTV